jgi:membrane glycosyltransferase
VTAAFRLPLDQTTAKPPLAMPDQSFLTPFTDLAAPGIRSPRSVRIVRLAVLTLPLCVTLALAWMGLGWFLVDGHLAATEAALLAVTAFAFYWVVLSVATAALGLFWRPRPQASALHGLSVAILLPMYGEPAGPTIANTLALLAALTGKGRHRFSLHILSDTRDPKLAQAELAAVKAARLDYPGLALHYRRREANADYKSGNIRDWVTTRGQHHDAMLILDADSVMGADSVVLMADRMATEPGLGLIQTVPRVLPGHSLWQRLQSFASEVYGTNLGRGFALWTGTEGNFLGHNALVRTRAFAASAGLPHLPGTAPRGGVILSHDFVEAALIRRAGWGVEMLPEASESFEDTPETLPGYLRRDRRWCQGNMQHLRLLATPGLHIVSRFHLLQGAMAYLASVWWLVFLALWTLSGPGGAAPDPFLTNPLMPVWPELPPVSQAVLTGTVVVMLMGPKLLGIAAHLRDRGFRLRQMPGFAASVLVEVALSILLAPSLMVHQVRAVLRTLAGFDGGWVPHLAERPGFRTLLRFHLTETALGAALLGLCAVGRIDPWLLPVAGGLFLTSLISWLVQRDVASRWLLRPLGVNT